MDTKFNYKINVTYWNDKLTDKFILVPISLDDDVKDQLNSNVKDYVKKHLSRHHDDFVKSNENKQKRAIYQLAWIILISPRIKARNKPGFFIWYPVQVPID